jgi:hypothetical protein
MILGITREKRFIEASYSHIVFNTDATNNERKRKNNFQQAHPTISPLHQVALEYGNRRSARVRFGLAGKTVGLPEDLCEKRNYVILCARQRIESSCTREFDSPYELDCEADDAGLAD